MSVLPIVIAPDPRLKLCSEAVQDVDQQTKKLVDDMFETMYANKGLGLAAVQVGVHKRVLVVDIPQEYDCLENQVPGYLATGEPLCVINPQIVEMSEELLSLKEGCLSIPEQSAEIKRPKCIIVKYLDYNGEEQIIRAQGWLARCLEHEIDHLNGQLFWDHLSKIKRDMAVKSANKMKLYHERNISGNL